MAQLLHLGYLVFTRPFINMKDNLVEVFNELSFSAILLGLIHLNEEERWTKAFTKTYVYLLMTPGFFILVVSLSKWPG